MSKYNSKNSNSDHLNLILIKRLKVYSETYIKHLENYFNGEKNSLLSKKLYKPFYLE